MGGKLDLFDLTDPAKPRLAGHQPLPPDPFDGTPVAILDVAVLTAQDTPQALVAAGRGGLLHIDLSGLHQSPPQAELLPVEVHDTPGWAAGIVVTRDPLGGWKIVLGDQKSGARVYAWRYED